MPPIRNHLRHKAIQSAVAAVLLTASSGCGASDPGGHPLVQPPDSHTCVVDGAPSGTGISAGAGRVTGTLSIVCGDAILDQHITMKLLYHPADPGQVHAVHDGSAELGGASSVVATGLYHLDVPCAAGWWKLDAQVSVTMAAGKSAETVPLTAVRLSDADCGREAATPTPTNTGASNADPCAFQFTAWHVTAHAVTGVAQVGPCPEQPKAYNATLTLQRQQASAGDSWKAVDSSSPVFEPNVALFVSEPCHVATYRMRLSTYGIDAHGRQWNVTYTSSEHPEMECQ